MTRRIRVLLSPRRLVSLAITLAILAVPALTALTAAPVCLKSCLPGLLTARLRTRKQKEFLMNRISPRRLARECHIVTITIPA